MKLHNRLLQGMRPVWSGLSDLLSRFPTRQPRLGLGRSSRPLHRALVDLPNGAAITSWAIPRRRPRAGALRHGLAARHSQNHAIPRRPGGRAFGPGIFDMKASLAIFLAVMQELMGHRHNWPRPIWALFTSDEELGSPSSRELIERLALDCAYVLVLEPAWPTAASRPPQKGVGRFHLDIEGKAAHSGVAPQEGRARSWSSPARSYEFMTCKMSRVGPRSTSASWRGAPRSMWCRPARPPRSTCGRSPSSRPFGLNRPSKHEHGRTRQSLDGEWVVQPAADGANSGERIPLRGSPAARSGDIRGRRAHRRIDRRGERRKFHRSSGHPDSRRSGCKGRRRHADNEHILVDSLPERAAFLHLLLMHLKAQS